jgi:hypothetical protein
MTDAGATQPQRGFLSTEPAATWEQGLLLGNGTIGANVFGRPLDERIVFTHERLFLPQGPPTMPPPNGARLFEIRRLIDEGLYSQATLLAFQSSGQDGFMYPDPFVPAFDMRIRTKAEGDTSAYSRSVDFATGVATVRWSDTSGAYRRRAFVSRADGACIIRIDGPAAGCVSFRLDLTPRELSNDLPEKTREGSAKAYEANVRDVIVTAEEDTLTWRNAFSNAYPGSIQALEAVVRVHAPGGTVKADGLSLIIDGADHALLLVGIELPRDPARSAIDALTARLDELPADYDALLERHAPVHGKLFGHTRLDLGGGDARKLTTEQLLERATGDTAEGALIEKEFDAGRYNIISSTGDLPPTLQGLWAGTYVPPWASDYTHNGNVPSAIASILMGNMPELMLAYTSYIESIVPYLEINAANIFGARGVVLPSRSTTNGFNNALNGRFAGGFWVAGAAWAAHFFYDYYLYTGDAQYLVEHALPFMEKAAVFFEDYLYEGSDGKYVFSPTQSAENTPANTDSQGSFNATMDMAAATELLQNLIAGSRAADTNAERIPVWERMLEKMPSYQIGPDGALKEWLTPKLDDQLNHRHSSHLYAIYDGLPDSIAEDEELMNAFRRVIEIKLDRHWKESSGFMSFGVVQLGLAAASLGEAKLAYRCVVHLANRYWLHNLASMHNHRSLLNMDISGGMPAVIIKMLVASEQGKIDLLPALPSAWATGAIEGVLCRGQIEVVKLAWDKGRMEVQLKSAIDQSITLRAPRPIESITIVAGDAQIAPTDDECARLLTLPADTEVCIEIAT